MKLLNVVLLMFFSVLACAEPTLSKGQAVGIISQSMRDTPLMWSPFPIPYAIDQGSKEKDALLLDALYRHQLLQRVETVKMVEFQQDGRTRRRAEALWHYDYPPEREADAEEGFYYGYGRLIKLLSLSEPKLVVDVFYVEAKVEWAVSDLQGWVKDPAFKVARTLRRSLESAKKPFESKIILQFDGKDWSVWKAPQENY